MSTKTFPVIMDTGLMQPNYGNGAGTAMWAAYDGNYNIQSCMALKFGLDFTGVGSIASAVLYIKSYHLMRYRAPRVNIFRATSDWIEGTYNGGDNGAGYQAGSLGYPGPSTTGTGGVQWSPGTAHDAWCTVDITDIVKAWAPTNTIGGGNQPNYGIVISAIEMHTNTYNWDAYTKEGGAGAYIVLTYDAPGSQWSSIDGDDWAEITTEFDQTYPWRYYTDLYKGQCTPWKKGLQIDPINDQTLDPSNDCFAGVVEVRALREVIPVKTILPLALQRIDNNSHQITYHKTFLPTDTITTADGFRKFEPGGYFSRFGVTWTGATTMTSQFFADDCAGCYPDGFAFGIVDHANNMVYESDSSSGNVPLDEEYFYPGGV